MYTGETFPVLWQVSKTAANGGQALPDAHLVTLKTHTLWLIVFVTLFLQPAMTKTKEAKGYVSHGKPG